MEEINFRQLCKNLKKRGYEPAEKGVSDFVEEYEKIVFSVEPKNMRLKDIVNKMKDLSDHTRAVWIDGILREFGNGFGSEKWREGYEQGKFEGEFVGQQLKDADKIRRELNKPVVPQFVADWIKYCKFTNVNLQNALFVGDVYFYNYANQKDFSKLKEFLETENNQATFVRAWLDGYEVEKEKRYTVKIKAVLGQYLGRYYLDNEILTPQFIRTQRTVDEKIPTFTRSELEEANFGWVFDCEGIEIEEVK